MVEMNIEENVLEIVEGDEGDSFERGENGKM